MVQCCEQSNHEQHEKIRALVLFLFVLFVTFVVKIRLVAEFMVQCASLIVTLRLITPQLCRAV